MSAGQLSSAVRRLRVDEAPAVVAMLEAAFGGLSAADAALLRQHLLDALDHGEHERFLVWPGEDPAAVLYAAPNASAIPAGDPAAARALAPALERSGWRVLIGEAPLTQALVQASSPPLFRRGPRVREQRFMVLRRPLRRSVGGLRQASLRDLEAITEFACKLHEEDLMGPPISRSGRGAVRVRMMEAVSRSTVWVVERDGVTVGKVDLSLCSHRRGAQIAGVYVVPQWRNRGVATAAVGEVAALLHDQAFPGVTLHVRADNAAAVAAYESAGFEDVAPLVLALR
jgi:ribosomal protein S18 acetylase RimI-like enzyme